MHISALATMKRCVDAYLIEDREYQILDFGSFINNKQQLHHRLVLRDIRCTITGVDIGPGTNVDLTMPKPYTIPVRSNSQDVVMTGQAFEHIPFPFASILEIARVLKPGGYLFLTAPSRGHQHYLTDMWRYYPDSMRAFAKYAELDLIEASTAWPEYDKHRLDYAAIRRVEYWGDTLGVFRKPHWSPSLRRTIYRWVVKKWANHLGDIDDVPRPGNDPTPQQRAADRAALRAVLSPSPAGAISSPARRGGIRGLVAFFLKRVLGPDRTEQIKEREQRVRMKLIELLDIEHRRRIKK